MSRSGAQLGQKMSKARLCKWVFDFYEGVAPDFTTFANDQLATREEDPTYKVMVLSKQLEEELAVRKGSPNAVVSLGEIYRLLCFRVFAEVVSDPNTN